VVEQVTVIAHPLVQHNLARLRNALTQPEEFRRCLSEVAALMVYEATRTFETVPVNIETPLAVAQGRELARPIVLVPILRAGLGMLNSILQLLPHASVGFIGVKRDETSFKAEIYHNSLPPDLGTSEVILIDPMLATGGSALAALGLVADRNAQRVRLVSLVAAPEGLRNVQTQYPNLPIFVAAVDERLNEKAYIVPGLGDAGDRLFGP
jgi:uracil phosphoribosyltransferase